MSNVRIDPALPGDLEAIRALLASLQLPASDVGAGSQRFVIARDGGDVVGCAGLEPYGRAALLRSLAVTPARQGERIGQALYERILEEARAVGAEELYLLTTTAERLFARLGFERVAREAVPADVRASAEFASLCPATAVCMRRSLGVG